MNRVELAEVFPHVSTKKGAPPFVLFEGWEFVLLISRDFLIRGSERSRNDESCRGRPRFSACNHEKGAPPFVLFEGWEFVLPNIRRFLIRRSRPGFPACESEEGCPTLRAFRTVGIRPSDSGDFSHSDLPPGFLKYFERRAK
jgi:hypothetical protein